MKPNSTNSPSVSVVMNVFRRGYQFERQLEAVLSQSHQVSEILIWENGHDTVTVGEVAEQIPVIRVRSEKNLGVWARFSLGLAASSDFVWVIDDDVIPGSRWLENALETYSQRPCLVGSRGIKLWSDNSYLLYEEVGPNAPNIRAEQVDFVGHNWILPTAWLGYFWHERANAFNSAFAGEDMHVSFAVQKHLGFPTIVPPHPPEDLERWGELPQDEDSSRAKVGISERKDALRLFETALRHYVKRGFQVGELIRHARDERGVKARLLRSQLVGWVARHFPQTILKTAKLLGLDKQPNWR